MARLSFSPCLRDSVEGFKMSDDNDEDYYDYDDFEDYDDPFEDAMDCGLMRDGTCSMAGSEYCDWDCPFSRNLR